MNEIGVELMKIALQKSEFKGKGVRVYDCTSTHLTAESTGK